MFLSSSVTPTLRPLSKNYPPPFLRPIKAEGREPSGPRVLACNNEDNLPIGEVGRGSGRVGRSVHPLLLVAWYGKCPPRAYEPDPPASGRVKGASPRQKRTGPELSHALGPVRLFDNGWPITLNRCCHWGYARFSRVAKLGLRGRKTGCNLLCGNELDIVEQCFSGGVRKQVSEKRLLFR